MRAGKFYKNFFIEKMRMRESISLQVPSSLVAAEVPGADADYVGFAN